MSSYKPHAVAGMIFALPFIPSIFYLFFALIGASIPDMDHHNNNNKVYSMFIVGIILSLFLFFFNGGYMSGLIMVSLALIFYLSKHRGFTHTLIGIVLLCFLFMLMIMGFMPVFGRISLMMGFNFSNNFALFVILALIGYFVVSRKYLLIYLLSLAIYLIVLPVDYTVIQWSMVFLVMFIGALSHLILDLWTPAGLRIFKPLSNIKFHKSLAIFFICIWLCLSIFVLWNDGSFITNFTSIFMYT